MKEEGYCVGDICNRDGCQGIIAEHATDGGCSCHINPPCSYCTTSREYCPECDWDGEEEQRASYKHYEPTELQKVKWEAEWELDDIRRKRFYEFYSGKVEATEIGYRSETHTHFTMKIIGYFPKGTTMEKVQEKVQGTFGGRFERFTDCSFIYIAYSD